jgi:hypothetical protein
MDPPMAKKTSSSIKGKSKASQQGGNGEPSPSQGTSSPALTAEELRLFKQLQSKIKSNNVAAILREEEDNGTFAYTICLNFALIIT